MHCTLTIVRYLQPIQQRQGTGGRRRLQLADNEKPRFIKEMGIWYQAYESKDSETFLEDMNNAVSMILEKPMKRKTFQSSLPKKCSSKTSIVKNDRKTINGRDNKINNGNDNSSVVGNTDNNFLLIESNEGLINDNDDDGKFSYGKRSENHNDNNNNNNNSNAGKKGQNMGMKSKGWYKNDKNVQYHNYLMKWLHEIGEIIDRKLIEKP